MRLHSFHQKARLSAASAIDQLRNLLARSADGAVTHQLDLSELEDRILLSASPAAVMAESSPTAESAEMASPLDSTSESLFETSLLATPQRDSGGPSSSDSGHGSDADGKTSNLTLSQPSSLAELDEIASSILSEQESPTERSVTEVVFVDDSAADFEQLIADLEAQRDSGRAIDFFVLDSHSDGVDQIAETLERYSDLDAVHIVSHGESGAVKLGGTWLRIGSLDGYAGAIAGWGSAFSSDGDLLFYGCDLASNTRGEMLIHSVAALTGADVAASTDDTGHETLGGDWDLEYETGRVDSEVVFTEQTQKDWIGKLAVINVTTTDDVVDSGDGLTSLREAIIQSNMGSGGDTISLSAGTYTLSISGTGENDSATGDLDVTKDVTIVGAGQNLTIINANGIDRVFEVRADANFTVEDLTIAGGSTSGGNDGAGVEARNAGSLIATRVIFTGNASGREGGAIHAIDDPVSLTDVALVGNSAATSGGGLRAEGVTTLTRVTVSGNSAVDGAGIHQFGSSSDFTLVNVTVSGNVASGEGGGIWTNRTMSVTNSTIAFNVANDGAGLYIHGSNGNLSLRNSILASNTQFDSQPHNVSTNNDGILTSLGFNISSDGTAALSGPSDQSNTDPLINPTLSLNGGTTETHALQSGSPAINGGTTVGAPTTDQRGVTRDAIPDIGSYEIDSVSLVTTNEFLVNNATGNTQETSNEDRGSTRAVAIAPNGEYVVVWSSNQNSGSDGDGFGVLMQRFDAAGNEIGSEQQVNTQTSNDQFHASVAIDDSGRGVIVWTETDGSSSGVRARLFSSDGTLNGGQIVVDSTSSGDQDNSAVAMDAAGNFVVVWEGNGPGDSSGIFAQRFDSNGLKLGSEFRVNSVTGGGQGDPSVAMNSSGQFAIVWDDGGGVHARTYEADGTGGSGSQFNVDGGSSAGEADIGIDDAGRAIVVWRETNGIFGKGVYHRAFDFDGSALTGTATVNSQILNDQTNPSITVDSAGNHIVAWEGAGFTDSSGVMFQKYDSSFSRIGFETAVNQTTSGTQNQVSLAMLDSDNFVVVWSGEGPGDSDGVFARQYSLAAPVNSDPTADAGGPYTINEGESVNLDGSASSDPDTDPLTFAWDLDNDGNFGEPGEPTAESPTVDWSTLQTYGIDDDGVYTIGLRVDDGRGGINTTTTTLTVNNVAPILNATGAGSTTAGNSYTLNLSAVDPEPDTISSWTINWGDGSIETFAGNPSSVAHTYLNGGFTNNITVSATDEDGAYTSSDLLLTSNATSSLFRFGGNTGVLVSEFAIASGLVNPVDIEVGPDGLIYSTGFSSNDIRRYDSGTGAFVDTFVTSNSGGLNAPSRMAWGIDGHLYVTSMNTDEVLRYDGTSGAFIDAFVSAGSGGLDQPDAISFGPTGNVYVSSNAAGTILEFDGSTGAFIGTFASVGSTGFTDITFGPDDHLYVSNVSANTVQRFNGSSGNFIDTFVSSGSGGINGAAGLVFGPDGHLYVAGFDSDGVFRYDGSTGAFVDVFVPSGSGQDQLINLAFLPELQVAVNSPPVADGGGPYVIAEGAVLNLNGSASSDPDNHTLTFAWDLDNDGNYAESGEPTTETPTVSWATLQSFGITDDPDSPFTIGLQVDDGNGGVNTTTTTLTVNNVAPTGNPNSGAGFTTNEDSAFTTGSVLTNDTDANILDVLSVTNLDSTATSGIVTDNGDGTFSYDPNGQFESLAQGQQTTDTFSYTVSDDDGGSSITTVTITIDGANDAPADIMLDNLSVSENVAGAVVGNLTTSDVDAGDSHTYSVDDTRFEVVGGQLKLKAGQSLDFETEPTVPITITTTDSGTASFNEAFVISVGDVNEAPTVSLSQTSTTLAENTDTSSAIVLAAISISDDALGSNSLALSGTDAASFEIVGGNLRLKAATPLDFETQTTYSVTVEVNDPLVGSNPNDSVNFTLIISDIDESPVITTSAGVATFTEDAGPVAVDSTLIVSDPDDAGFVGAEVRFDSGFMVAQDDLLFTNQSGISGSYNATSGVLTLSGTASVADYETALRSATYSNSSQNPNTGNRVLRFTVNDGLNTDTATRTLTVTALDDPANVVTGGPYAVIEGASVALDGSASNDIDNFVVEYTWDFDYDGVTFTTDSTGSSTSFSAVGIDGPDTRTIALRTRSDNGIFAIATTTVTISNVAPTANADSDTGFTTDEDSVFVSGNVLSNDTDPGPESLAVSSLDTTGTTGLVIDRGDGTFTYNPNGQFESLAPGQSANDTFTYTVSDGNASDTATVTILISGANDDPIVTNQNVSVDENAALNTLVATAAATDIDDGDSVSWTIVSGNTNGAFSINSTSGEVRVAKPLELDFETNPSYSLSVRAADENGGVDFGLITVSLNDLNETPTANNATFGIAENSALGASVGIVSASDPDTGDTLSWSILSGNTNGAFAISTSTGEVTVANSAALDFEVTPSFNLVVEARDVGGLADTANVAVGLTNQNETPSASDATFGLAENSANGTVVGTTSATDPDAGDSLTWSIVSGNVGGAFTIGSSSGQISVANSAAVDFEVNPVFNLTVRAQDAGGRFDTAAVDVSLTNQNEVPTATDAVFAVSEDAAPGLSVGVFNGSDPDAADTRTWSILSGNTNGAFSLNAATGEFSVASPSTLDFETTPSYTLSVQLQDAAGLTDSATVVVNVSNVNEGPTTTGLADVFVNEDSADVVIDLTAAFSDVETPSAALSYSIVGNSNSTLFSGTPIVGGNLTLKFAANANGNAFVTVRATDPQGLFVTTAFNVVVAPVADAPTSAADSYVVLGDQLSVPSAGGVLANDSDPDGDAISALLVSGPANGSLVLLSNGGFTYTPDDEFTGIDTFVYEPFDGTSTGPQRTVVLNVTRIIAPPPPPSSEGAAESSEASEAESTSEGDAEQTAETTVEAPLSATASASAESSTQAAEAESSPESTSSDEDAEEEIAAAYTATESAEDFFGGGAERLELRDATSVSVKTLGAVTSDGVSPDSDNRFRDSLRFDGEDLSYLVSTEFIQELEQVEDSFEFDGTVPEWATGTAVATTASISVGYIMWMLRGGYVLASVLSTMPVWQNIDPLPVLAALDAADDDDDDSLESMIDRASDEADGSEDSDADEAASDAERKDKIV